MNEHKQRMREHRTPIEGWVMYRHAPDESGAAAWLNVSRVGAAIRLGRYLRPGRHIQLSFERPFSDEETVETEARVAWCRPVAGTSDYVAGLQVYRDTPEAALAFATLGYLAQREANKTGGLKVVSTVWMTSEPVRGQHKERTARAAMPQAV